MNVPSSRRFSTRPADQSHWARRIVAVLAVLALVLVVSPTWADASGDRRPSQPALARMQAAMDAMVADGTPGMYVAVRQGHRLTELHSGRPDQASDRTWTDRSHFRVASVTKTFVAAVVMQLVAEGRLQLSDPVERWLPGLLPYGQQITVRQLLNHTSGVPAYGDLEFLAGRFDEPGRRFTPQELLARIEGQPLGFTPGTAANYVNTGYVLLGMIVERVGGQPLDVALYRRILAPLRLSDTSFDIDRNFPAPRVRGYSARPGTTTPVLDVTRMNPSWAWGAGNIVSSARDVTTFLRALMTGRVVPQPQLDQMRVVDPIAVDPTGTGFALGLESIPYSCGNFGKNGSMPGYGTIAQSTTDGRRQVLWAANSVDWLLRPVEPVLFLELHAALGQLLCERH